ncbi:MAG: filamentous hemagglutinin N-terminal domain-containing protein, partial [Nitrospirota bacterium]
MSKQKKSSVSAPSVVEVHLRRSAIAAAVAAAFWSQGALALPTGGVVTHGSSVITTPSATVMNVNQSTPTSIIEWQTFNIARPESVIVTQPAGGSALYRIGAQSASEIYGRLSASGTLILSNPAGVYFMPGASVDVKGLVATSLSISDASYLSGNWVFTNPGGAGAVVNQGTITAAGGYAVLAAPHVQNDGVISARMGTVALAAGDQVKLDMVGDGLISVQVPQAALNAAAINKGTLAADGGTVLMTARSANAILDTVINTEGVVRADTIAERNGIIVLDGGDKGVVSVSGAVSAQGADAGTTGGTVKVLGQYVGVGLNGASASINASGDAGGGTVLVGGNFQGKGPEQNAFRTYVGQGATISADAGTNGDGGRVIVWADDITRFYGTISARGGAQGGDGGFAEVSGKGVLDYRGLVNLRAPNGTTGTLLLDPTNIEVAAASESGVTLSEVDQFADADVNSGGGGADATTNTIAASAIVTGLNGANVTLQANNDITVNAAIDASGNAGSGNLTMQAGRSILINQNITLKGSFTATANDNTASAAGRTDSTAAEFTMADGTAINTSATNSNIVISMLVGPGGTGENSGDITISTLNAGTGHVHINQGGQTPGSDILRTTTSAIIGTSAALEVSNTNNTTGAIGMSASPINVTVTNLDARVLNGSGGIFINSSGALNIGSAGLGTIVGINTSSGNLEVTAGGAVTQTEQLSIGGTTSVNAGANAITLTQAGNDFQGAVTATGTGISITDANALTVALTDAGAST